MTEAHYKGFLFSSTEIACESCERKWKTKEELEVEVRKAKEFAERQAELQAVIEKRELPIVVPLGSKIIFKKGEQTHLTGRATLIEERMVREYLAGHSGIRIAKGVYLGGTKGKSESHGELRAVDGGDLTLTNQRLIFNGEKKNVVIQLKKVATIEKPYNDAFEVGMEGKSKVQLFQVDDAEKWVTFARVAIENAIL